METRFRGDRLKGVREAKGLTLPELASRCGKLHVSRLARYEKGPDEPRAGSLAQIVEALEISADYLLGGKWGDEVPFGTVAARESLNMFLRSQSQFAEKRVMWLNRVAEDSHAPMTSEGWTALVRHVTMADFEKLAARRPPPVKAKGRTLQVVHSKRRTTR